MTIDRYELQPPPVLYLVSSSEQRMPEKSLAPIASIALRKKLQPTQFSGLCSHLTLEDTLPGTKTFSGSHLKIISKRVSEEGEKLRVLNVEDG